MTGGTARAILFVFLLAATGAAAWYHQVLEQERAAATLEVEQLGALRDTVNAGIARARSAQQAYLAPGQGLSYWSTEFAEALAETAGALEGLKATEAELVGAPSDALEAADRAYRVYEALDRKIRGFVQTGNLMMAADVVYEDGVKTSGLIVSSVGDACDALARPMATAADEAATRQQLVAAGAVAAGLLVSLLLLPRGRSPRAGDESTTAGSGADGAEDLPLTQSDRQMAPTPVVAPVSADVATVGAQPPAATVAEDSDARTALRATAVVCTDLGRVKDGEQLRAVLGRAASVLDASGVIVWVADAAGRQLRPVFAYGYPEEALRRIPALPRTADNATVMAWREGRPQVVDATETAPGAIAVPLLGPQGCTGVLAAEIEHGREASAHTRAVAEIMAAQLAVLIPAETPAPVAESADG